MPTPDPVLVIGGGPAGSATALRLSTLGHAVTLIDRARFPRDKCCSEYGAPGTIRELASLGLLDTLTRHGVGSLVGTRVTGAGGSTLLGRFALAATGARGMALPRLLLDHVLLEA
ncbi:MAG: FAD-dependent oxidoreductase, partial [Gemmatimonadota bacterium]